MIDFTSKYKGIYYRKDRKKWRARIMINRQLFNLGNYNTEEEAHEAYLAKTKELIPNNYKNISCKKRQPKLKRNKDGFIERTCEDCGKIKFFKKAPQRTICPSCRNINRYKNKPANGLKQVNNLNEIIKDYESGLSLISLQNKYNITATTIRNKIIASGHILRDNSQANAISKSHERMHKKIKELCQTGEFQKNMSIRLQGISSEDWKGFATPENKRFYASPEYKNLRKQVLKRDNYQCKICDNNEFLELHHIKPKAKYPLLKLDIDNCIMLCEDCHHKTVGTEEKYINKLMSLI